MDLLKMTHIYLDYTDRHLFFFEGNFFDAVEFLELKGVRRAIIAYWTESLIEMQERGRLSLYARNHNWNAVAELKKRILYNTV